MISFVTFAAGLFTARAIVSALVFLGTKDHYKARIHALAVVLAALAALWGWGVF